MYFLHKIHQGLIALRNTRQRLSTTLGGHLKQQNLTPKKYKMQKTWPWVDYEKNTAYNIIAKIRQGMTLFNLRWEHMSWATQIFTTLYMSVNDHESSRSIYLGVTNNFSKSVEFVSWDPRMRKIDCIYIVIISSTYASWLESYTGMLVVSVLIRSINTICLVNKIFENAEYDRKQIF